MLELARCHYPPFDKGPPIVAKIGRKERLRRERISRGLRAYHQERRERREQARRSAERYWRQVRRVEKAERLSRAEARDRVRTIRQVSERERISFAKARERTAPPVVEWRADHRRPEMAFNLKDVIEGGFVPDLSERFRDRARVRAEIQFTYMNTKGIRVTDDPRWIEFEPGESLEEFWINYKEALSRDISERGLELEDAGEIVQGDSDFAIALLGMRAA